MRRCWVVRQRIVYLSGRLSFELTKTYLKHYDAALDELNQRSPATNDERMLAKRRSKLSVRLLYLCDQIQSELGATDRMIMFARLSELAKATGTIDEADSFLNSVSSALMLSEQDAWNIKQLVKCDNMQDAAGTCVFFSAISTRFFISSHRLQCVCR